MPFPTPMIKVQIIGDCFNQQEIWTTGFYMGNGFSGTTPSLPGDTAQKIAAAWETEFFTVVANKISSRYRTVSVKANLVDVNGVQTTNPTQEYFYPTPIVGPNAASPVAPQLSIVGSLRGALPRGYATHGRMYLPGIVSSIDSDARIPSADATAIAGNLRDFLLACNNADPDDNVVMMASKKGAGTKHVVTKVMIGNLYDTQRRRRNQFTEAYTTASL
jgi:hypothetical protein